MLFGHLQPNCADDRNQAPPPARSARRTRLPEASTGSAGPGTRGCGCAPRLRRSPSSAAEARLRSSSRVACARPPRRIVLPSSCLLWLRVPRAGQSDARLGHEIKACRARFHPDLLAADVVQATDAAGEDVAEGAQAPWVDVGFVVVRHGGRRARCLYPCISAMETLVFRIGGSGGQNACWQARNAVCSAWRGLAKNFAGFMMGGGGISRL